MLITNRWSCGKHDRKILPKFMDKINNHQMSNPNTPEDFLLILNEIRSELQNIRDHIDDVEKSCEKVGE